jgi:hypothetical protein
MCTEMTAGMCAHRDLELLYAKYCLNDEVKEDEMGGACGTYGGDKCLQAFVGKNSAKETTWRN